MKTVPINPTYCNCNNKIRRRSDNKYEMRKRLYTDSSPDRQ